MSYVCLFANERCAAAASDSRENRGLDNHTDDRQKTFCSDRGEVLYACCGVTRRSGRDCFRRVERLMRSDRKSFDARLESVTAYMQRQTALQHRETGSDSRFTMLAASYWGGQRRVISLDLLNGEAKLRERTLPIGLQAGKDVDALPSFSRYHPSPTAGAGVLSAMARTRVSQAIARDRARKASDPGYADTIGGEIQCLCLAWE